MIEITFTIKGNQDDPLGNPMPKIRKTHRQAWTPAVRKYMRWKEHVQKELIRAIEITNKEAARDAARNIAAVGKPLVLGDRRAYMDIVISWKNGTHGDPENIFGSIADALFYNDKELYGSFDPEDDTGITSGKGQVRCIIRVSDPQPKRPRRKLKTISE